MNKVLYNFCFVVSSLSSVNKFLYSFVCCVIIVSTWTVVYTVCLLCRQCHPVNKLLYSLSCVIVSTWTVLYTLCLLCRHCQPVNKLLYSLRCVIIVSRGKVSFILFIVSSLSARKPSYIFFICCVIIVSAWTKFYILFVCSVIIISLWTNSDANFNSVLHGSKRWSNFVFPKRFSNFWQIFSYRKRLNISTKNL